MRYFQFIGLIILSLMILSCGGDSSNDISRSSSNTSTVIVSVGGQGGSAIGAPQLAPAGVASVRFYITGSGMDPIERTVLVTGTSVSETFDVPIGPNRHFEVFAYTADGTLYYYGDGYADLSEAGGGPVTVSITLSIEGLTPDALLALCESAVSGDNLSAANDFCRDASYRYGSEVSNEADTARFFHALTFFFDTVSDGDLNNGLNTASDILDAFNCTHAGSIHDDPVCSDPLPGNSPTGLELQNFLFNVGRPALEDIISTLLLISPSFNYVWLEPVDGTSVESDYGDIFVFRALAKGGLALLLMQDAHDVNVDIDFEANNEDSRTKQDFLADNPNFGTLTSTSNLNTARNYLDSAADDLDAAIVWMDAEADNQDDDLISLSDMDAQDILDARADISTAKDCLVGQCTVEDEGTGTTLDDTIINLSPFFAGSVNPRGLLPTIVGDDPVGFLPFPYMDGVFVQLDGFDPSELNNDKDGNSTADIFEEGIYYVYAGNDVSGDTSPGKWDLGHDPEAYGFTFLGAANSKDGVAVVFGGAYSYYLIRGPLLYFNWSESSIDAVYFNASPGEWCCSQPYWSSLWMLPVTGPADGWWGIWLHDDDYILMTAPGGTTSIDVYGLPFP